jgi:hypothetical protein
MMYVCLHTERDPDLWTVGFYQLDGKFHPIKDYPDKDEAEKAVEYGNTCKMVSYDPEKI